MAPMGSSGRISMRPETAAEDARGASRARVENTNSRRFTGFIICRALSGPKNAAKHEQHALRRYNAFRGSAHGEKKVSDVIAGVDGRDWSIGAGRFAECRGEAGEQGGGTSVLRTA